MNPMFLGEIGFHQNFYEFKSCLNQPCFHRSIGIFRCFFQPVLQLTTLLPTAAAFSKAWNCTCRAASSMVPIGSESPGICSSFYGYLTTGHLISDDNTRRNFNVQIYH